MIIAVTMEGSTLFGRSSVFYSVKDVFDQYLKGLSRRELFPRGGLLSALPAFLGASRAASAASPATAGKLQLGPDVYKSIVVRPLINCRGTLTVISGSLELPEVRAAQDAATQHFVHLDELMEAIGQLLAALPAPKSGIVSVRFASLLAQPN